MKNFLLFLPNNKKSAYHARITYLTLIQGVITRIANHNTTVRNWTYVTLIAMLGVEISHPISGNAYCYSLINLLIVFPPLVFMVFYHWKEHQLIWLYNLVDNPNFIPKNFCLSPKTVARKIDKASSQPPTWRHTLRTSKFNLFFGLAVIVLAVGVPIEMDKVGLTKSCSPSPIINSNLVSHAEASAPSTHSLNEKAR